MLRSFYNALDNHFPYTLLSYYMATPDEIYQQIKANKGGKYNATAPTYGDGDRADNQADVNGNLQVNQRTLISGEDQTNDVLKTEHQFSYATAAVTSLTAVKAAAGFLHSMTVGSISTPTLTIYDNTAGSGAILFRAGENLPRQTYIFDEKFSTGITAVFSVASGILPFVNFSYR